jgi:hypothetical protein
MRYSILQCFARTPHYLAATIAWIAVALLAAPRCSAQARGTVEFSPVLGVYLPSGRFTAVQIGCGGKCYIQGHGRTRNSAVAFGGRMSAWVSERMAVDGSPWYSAPFVPTAPDGPAAVSSRRGWRRAPLVEDARVRHVGVSGRGPGLCLADRGHVFKPSDRRVCSRWRNGSLRRRGGHRRAFTTSVLARSPS